MINLIPKEEKKKMAIDFYYRLAILFLVVFGFCVLVAFISLLPSYFVSSVRNSTINEKLEVQKKEPLPSLDQTTLASINEINNKISLVENSQKNQFFPSMKVINAILSKKRFDIKIDQILYENEGIEGRKISISGTAPSREVLLLFRRALEDSPDFKSVDLPISNFIKGSNIQFSLSLVPA